MFLNKIFSGVPLRFWMGLSIVLMAICIFLVMTLANMGPQIRVMPQLFREDAMTANQLVEATAINPMVPLKEKKLIDEMLIRFYIENRHFYVPDIGELSYRYGARGPIARLSTPRVYRAFLKGKGKYLENVQNNPVTVTVDIVNIKRRDNVFYVDFDVYRFMDGRRAFGGTRRATVKIDHNKVLGERSLINRDFVNPYGFYVKSYDETALIKR